MNYNNGKPLVVEENNKEKMAHDFAEGNIALQRLLLTAWKNGIKTHACCNGHIKKDGELLEKPYINFVLPKKIWLKFGALIYCKFYGDKNVLIDFTYRDLDRLNPNSKQQIGKQYNIILTLNNVNSEELKTHYYNELTWLLRSNKFLLENSKLSQNFQKNYNLIKNIANFYQLNKFDDFYYSSLAIKTKDLNKNQFKVVKHYNDGFQFYKFFQNNKEFCFPKSAKNEKIENFLDKHQYINFSNINIYNYDDTELEDEEGMEF